MNEENQVYFVDSDKLPQEALARKHHCERMHAYKQIIWNIWKACR